MFMFEGEESACFGRCLVGRKPLEGVPKNLLEKRRLAENSKKRIHIEGTSTDEGLRG